MKTLGVKIESIGFNYIDANYFGGGSSSTFTSADVKFEIISTSGFRYSGEYQLNYEFQTMDELKNLVLKQFKMDMGKLLGVEV